MCECVCITHFDRDGSWRHRSVLGNVGPLHRCGSSCGSHILQNTHTHTHTHTRHELGCNCTHTHTHMPGLAGGWPEHPLSNFTRRKTPLKSLTVITAHTHTHTHAHRLTHTPVSGECVATSTYNTRRPQNAASTSDKHTNGNLACFIPLKSIGPLSLFLALSVSHTLLSWQPVSLGWPPPSLLRNTVINLTRGSPIRGYPVLFVEFHMRHGSKLSGTVLDSSRWEMKTEKKRIYSSIQNNILCLQITNHNYLCGINIKDKNKYSAIV